MSCISSVVLPLEPYEKDPSPSDSTACPDVPFPDMFRAAAPTALSVILAAVTASSANFAVVTLASIICPVVI